MSNKAISAMQAEVAVHELFLICMKRGKENRNNCFAYIQNKSYYSYLTL